MKHFFVVNPVSGNGIAVKKYLPQLLSYLKDSDLDYEIHRSLNKEEIGTYVRQHASAGDDVRFYAVGGDGTLCDVVNGAVGFRNVEVGVIPCGTGNDFVRNFTNRENFRNFEKLVNGKAMPVDVLKVGDIYSINMLNIGADCEVVARAAQLKSRSGSLSYIRGALDILPKNPKYKMVYTDESGTDHEEYLMLCAIANGHFCGGGFKSCPRASVDDGLMDVVIVRPVTGLRMLKLLLKYHNGTHLADKSAVDVIQYLQVRDFSLKPLDKVNVSIDGEVQPFTGADITIIPGAVKFVVPEGSEPI